MEADRSQSVNDRANFKKAMMDAGRKPSEVQAPPKLVKKNVLQSRKFPGTYIFEEKLGKGMQSTVWKFIRDG